MPRPRALPAGLPAAFTVADARDAGVTARRLRHPALPAPFSGVRTRTPPIGVAERARAYAPKLRPGDHFSHATALALHGGWIPDRLRHDLDVSAPAPAVRPRGRGVRGHKAAAGHVEVAGLPAVAPEVAWCQLAGVLSERELVIAGDALLRRADPVSTLDALGAVLARSAGARGIRRARRALERMRARTDSVAETELRLDAEDVGLSHFEVNPTVRDERGRFVAFGDLADLTHRVMLEYDGEQHRTDDRQYARDVARLDELARLGWRVIRVTKSHRGPARRAMLERTRQALLARGWRPA
ncbi:DUF559 domain-containing protein [Microbacterium aurum]